MEAKSLAKSSSGANRATMSKNKVTCPICSKDFKHKSDLRSHQRIHAENYQCAECGVTCDSKSTLLKHLFKSHRKLNICETCGKEFVHFFHLKQHILTHTGERPHGCQFCHRRFIQNSSLITHINLIHKGIASRFKCKECNKSFSHSGHLETHSRTHSGEKPFSCSFCDKSFTQQPHMIAHERLHTGIKPFKCQDCGKYFNEKSKLTLHFRRMHSGKRPFKCETCQSCFVNSSTLKRHQKGVHELEKNFKCSECEKTFSYSWDLAKHRQIHSDLRPFSCQICNQSFKQSTGLIVHMRIHSELKQFKCNECGKSFRHSSAFTYHRTHVHSGLKGSFQCPHCPNNRTFTSKRNLNQHIKVHHTDLKDKFECSECQQKFKRSVDLKSHVKAFHVGSKPKECDLYKVRRFNVDASLRNRVKAQHDISSSFRWGCQSCDQRFKIRTQLKNHVKESHSQKNLEETCRNKLLMKPVVVLEKIDSLMSSQFL